MDILAPQLCAVSVLPDAGCNRLWRTGGKLDEGNCL